MWLYTDLLQALKGEPLSSVYSIDGSLISVSAAPHCGEQFLRVQVKDRFTVMIHAAVPLKSVSEKMKVNELGL